MREILDVRLPEEWAQKKLGSFGISLSPLTRKIEIPTDSPQLALIASQIIEHERTVGPLGYATILRRIYERKELEEAEAFRLCITATFEPAGWETGTIYDTTRMCEKCGAGRIQISPLKLDLRAVPRGIDIARTIADEWIVSERLGKLMREKAMTGCDLRSVYEAHSDNESPSWYQLLVTGHAGETISPTKFGISYFNEDVDGKYRHPEHKVSGLNVLSEVYLRRSDWDGQDMALTADLYGHLPAAFPVSMIIISSRLYRLLRTEKIKDYEVEVAHLL